MYAIENNIIENKVKEEGDFFNFKYLGYNCCIKRHDPNGCLCGYIYLTDDNYFYDMPLENLNELIKVHGGWNFRKYEYGYTIGFYCGHAYDLRPNMPFFADCTYKTKEYVINQLMKAVDQMEEYKNGMEY